MQSSQPEKKHFEIFTENEITIKDEELKKSFLKMIKIINNGMHSAKGGWYDKISKAMTEDQKSELKSIDRYLEVSNKLQSPKKGEIRSLILHDKKFERPVNVYLSFWKQCYRAAFHAQIVRISKRSKEQLSNGLDKAYIYVLLQLKKDPLLHKWFDDGEREKFQNEIKKTIAYIRCQTKLDFNYYLNESDQGKSIHIYQSFIQKTHHLRALQAEYETNDIYTRYIHVRPAIFIQYVQALDYYIKKYEDTYKKRGHSLFSQKKPDSMYDLLLKKRYEFIDVLVFHQKLYETYQKDDFIEILHDVVRNIGTGFLPIQQLFEIDKALNIQLFTYDPEDPDIPSKVWHEEQNQWRISYLQKMKYLESVKPLKIMEVKSPETKHQITGFIPIQKLFFVINDALVSVKIPKSLSDELIHLCESNGRGLFTVLDFFVENEATREKFYKINRYYKDFTFLMQQVNQNGLISFLSVINARQVLTNQKCKNYLNELTAIIHLFKEPYQNEINTLSSHPLLDKYYDLLVETKKGFTQQVKKILFYWLDCLSKDFSQFAPLHENFKEFIDLLGEAVRGINDQSLTEKYGDICENMVSLTRRKKRSDLSHSLRSGRGKY